MVEDSLQLPDDLPVPQDDGAADHLAGMVLPALARACSFRDEHGLFAAAHVQALTRWGA